MSIVNNDIVFADPFLVPGTAVPYAALQALVARGVLAPSPASPLACFIGRAPAAAPAEQAAACEALAARGVSFPAPPGSAVAEPLEILARPRARLRMSVTSRDHEPFEVTLFVHGNRAALAVFGADEVTVRPAADLDQISDRLASALAGRPLEDTGGELLLWPSQLALGALMWAAAGQSPRDVLPRATANTRLALVALSPDEVEHTLADLVDEGFLAERNGDYALEDGYADALERMWSGSSVELTAAFSPYEESRMVFVGAAGSRLLCDTLIAGPGDDLEEDSALILRYLPRERLRAEISQRFRLSACA
ncbi:MAG: hypothetical protein HYV63_01870 [Candidatus Schekmanbacteria bacterium]|nr:hypothetical protein [Candidatus Schekmanbacteria bacterium]